MLWIKRKFLPIHNLPAAPARSKADRNVRRLRRSASALDCQDSWPSLQLWSSRWGHHCFAEGASQHLVLTCEPCRWPIFFRNFQWCGAKKDRIQTSSNMEVVKLGTLKSEHICCFSVSELYKWAAARWRQTKHVCCVCYIFHGISLIPQTVKHIQMMLQAKGVPCLLAMRCTFTCQCPSFVLKSTATLYLLRLQLEKYAATSESSTNQTCHSPQGLCQQNVMESDKRIVSELSQSQRQARPHSGPFAGKEEHILGFQWLCMTGSHTMTFNGRWWNPTPKHSRLPC